MCQVVIPQTRVLSPRRFIDDPAESSRYDPRTTSTIFNSDASPTDIPYGHANAYGGLGNAGGFVAYEAPSNPPPKDTIFGSVEYALQEAAKLNWTETGSPPNPNIAETWRIAVNKQISDDGKPNPWCTTFVSYILYKAGTEYLKVASSQAYASYGKAVNWRDYNNLRLNDIVIITNKSDPSRGHAGFLKGIDPNTKTFTLAGGNQGNTYKLSPFAENDSSRYVREVRRNWDIPPDFDKTPFSGPKAPPTFTSSTRTV
jgi:uncharacterized protein (TIGR02594 family)